MTLHIIAKLTAKPGKMNDVISELRVLVKESRLETGNLRYELLVPIDDSSDIYLIEKYDGFAALEAHRQSDHYKEYREKTAHLLQTPPMVEVITESI